MRSSSDGGRARRTSPEDENRQPFHLREVAEEGYAKTPWG